LPILSHREDPSLALIVVAVSNGAVRSSIAVACRSARHKVVAVADAGELLGMVKSGHPDVLILDPALSRLETVEPLRVMRLENRLVGMRIVLVGDGRAEGGPWASLARQLADATLESFRGPDVQKVLDAVLAHGAPAPAAPGRAAKAPPPPPSPPADPSRPTVVLVEDLPQLRALLGIRLEAKGWRVAWHGTAEDALRAVEAEGCEVVLSDINLPGMSGDQLVETVRKRFPGVWCFLMTALPRDRWPRVPPSIRIFAKPLDMDALEAALEEVRQVRRGR
jgi:DNA-binding response OmpR family regulator